MTNKNLVGRCSLYCGACIIYRAYKDSEKLRQKLQNKKAASLKIFVVKVARQFWLMGGTLKVRNGVEIARLLNVWRIENYVSVTNVAFIRSVESFGK